MAAKMFYDDAADLAIIRGKKVAIIGYGSQGHAHALNLKDSGVQVKVGLPAASKSRDKVTASGLQVDDVAAVSKWADIVMILAPDTSQAKLYNEEIEPNLKQGGMLMFAHGFNIRFDTIVPRKDLDVAMVAPKSPGHRVRELYVEGAGTPALFAIHQDATGQARAITMSYAKGIGVTRAGVIETTFKEETETDLFGEQAVLCGGVSGPKIVTDDTRKAMKQILTDIQTGKYAEGWIAENANGRPWFSAQRQQEQHLLIEKVGEQLRAMMPFLKPVKIQTEEPVSK